jgi:hypothetical protein
MEPRTRWKRPAHHRGAQVLLGRRGRPLQRLLRERRAGIVPRLLRRRHRHLGARYLRRPPRQASADSTPFGLPGTETARNGQKRKKTAVALTGSSSIRASASLTSGCQGCSRNAPSKSGRGPAAPASSSVFAVVVVAAVAPPAAPAPFPCPGLPGCGCGCRCPAAVKTATYRVAVGAKTAGIRW